MASAIAALPYANERWMTDIGKEDRAAIAAFRSAGVVPSICVHLHISADDEPSLVRKALKSAMKQSARPSRVFITSSGGIDRRSVRGDNVGVLPGSFHNRMAGLQAALAASRDLGADYLVPLAPNGSLPRHALAGYAAFDTGKCDGALPLLFADQQESSPAVDGARPWFKPLWDPRMILSQDYVSAACALPVRTSLACMERNYAVPPESIYELVLRITLPADTDTPVHHVQRIAMRTAAGDWLSNGKEKLSAVRRVVGPDATASSGPYGTVKLRWQMPQPCPKVSVIVATRDRVELLRTCVNGVLHETDYPDIELIIADNDSREAETLDYMEQAQADPRVQVVRWPHPFNYSAINNFAARSATGKYLCLLNNDIEVIEPQWLSEMVREAEQPGVGAVGARLLYPDRSIQHAGVAIGIGNAAGHAHRGLGYEDPGYYAQALIARGASAVTGACLLVAKRHFEAVGGLDEDKLAVAYNDVDFCLKLRELGLANIYTPASTLIHHESKSRGLDFAPEHLARYLQELGVFQQRWDTDHAVDPWHHSRLERNSEVYRKSGWAMGI
ncbi:glycosyltransferase family 2 protein [Qipengyuania qiaonensis]|uniref:glycosyltransferase family 2 protein n=1 Tax=Qipengyuania qiaonensis TaxID=2867240 RepID=UPI001C87D23B|nr:glycosyltransferase family 2 protein [Qipengyuania qiaonensis]